MGYVQAPHPHHFITEYSTTRILKKYTKNVYNCEYRHTVVENARILALSDTIMLFK